MFKSLYELLSIIAKFLRITLGVLIPFTQLINFCTITLAQSSMMTSNLVGLRIETFDDVRKQFLTARNEG